LHGVGSQRNFSSAELTMLVDGTASAAAVDKPYFVYARMAAANAVAAEQREALLRAALLNAPPTLIDKLRLQLFRVEMATGNYAQAEVAVKPLVNPAGVLFGGTSLAGDVVYGTPNSQDGVANNGASAVDDSSGDTASYVAGMAVANADQNSLEGMLSTPEMRREFLLLLAKVDEQLKDDGAAVRDLQAASTLTKDATEKAKVDAQVKTLQARISIAVENAERRPVIQPSVEQKVLVRPKLVAETVKVSR